MDFDADDVDRTAATEFEPSGGKNDNASENTSDDGVQLGEGNGEKVRGGGVTQMLTSLFRSTAGSGTDTTADEEKKREPNESQEIQKVPPEETISPKIQNRRPKKISKRMLAELAPHNGNGLVSSELDGDGGRTRRRSSKKDPPKQARKKQQTQQKPTEAKTKQELQQLPAEAGTKQEPQQQPTQPSQTGRPKSMLSALFPCRTPQPATKTPREAPLPKSPIGGTPMRMLASLLPYNLLETKPAPEAPETKRRPKRMLSDLLPYNAVGLKTKEIDLEEGRTTRRGRQEDQPPNKRRKRMLAGLTPHNKSGTKDLGEDRGRMQRHVKKPQPAPKRSKKTPVGESVRKKNSEKKSSKSTPRKKAQTAKTKAQKVRPKKNQSKTSVSDEMTVWL
jgi:hypothetical protein